MLNDEQILLKAVKLLENIDISDPKVVDLYEFNEKVLREITDNEMLVIEDVLDDLDPAELPLNDLFGGKMRAIIPFPTIDPGTELGKFAKFFKSQEYDVDWDKGMVFAERNTATADDLMNTLIGMTQGQPEKKKTKKIQMKIGKLFKKIADLSRKKDELYQKVYDHLAGIGDSGYKLPTGKPVTQPHQVTVKMRNAALDEKEAENLDRILAQIYLYIVNPGVVGPAGYNLTELATKYFQYWKDNAGFIKKEINNLDNDKFSIIITRHPIDVLRMSDFDEITSCHSPASRASAYQSYYKCAVAEAQGHGAVAYVVMTEDLLSATNTSNIDSAEQEIQEGEIFADDKRSFSGDIEPVSRIRVRHVRYYEGDEPPARWDDGQDVGMPEKRVYGADIPGLANQVTNWARSNQEEVIANMPKQDGMIDLSKFMIFGGSYEDTANKEGRLALMRQLVGPGVEVEGSMKQNTETEENLDADLIGDLATSYENQCQEIIDEWNRRAAVTTINFQVEDDGGEGLYIIGSAKVVIEWDKDDWKVLPTSAWPSVQHSADAINDIYGDLFNDGAYMGRQGDTIFWTCRVNLEHPELGGQSYYVMPEEFNEACQKIDSIIDDRHDAWKEILSTYFKREGQMVGGEYIQLAMDIENGEIDSYEWDVETDGEYENSYESYASYSFEYDSEEWKMSPQILERLLDSREFRLLLRTNLLASARQEVGTEYYLDIAHYTVTRSGEERVVQIQFKVDADDNAERVELFKELVTGEMDDEDNLTVYFRKTLAQIKADNMSGRWTHDINEQLVGNWRRFIS